MTSANSAIIQSTLADSANLINVLTTDSGKAENLEALLSRFLTAIIALAGAQAGAVRVLTDDGKSMRLLAQQGLPDDFVQTERLVDRQCGVCGMAANTDVLVWIDDLATCAKHGQTMYFGSQCKSMLAISLQHNHQILGIYNLFFDNTSMIAPSVQTLLRLVG